VLRKPADHRLHLGQQDILFKSVLGGYGLCWPVRYRCTGEGFSAETPLGERFQAKFDGNFYPVEDDPAHTMVMLKLLSPNTVEQTAKRDGKIVGVLRLTVAADGKTIHATYENKEDNTTTRSEMRKQE
jgi:hypothetical protein